MVIGEKENASQPTAVIQNAPSPASIDNIMSGISNTGSVKMNNHRKKLRQRYSRKFSHFLVILNSFSFAIIHSFQI